MERVLSRTTPSLRRRFERKSQEIKEKNVAEKEKNDKVK